MPILEGKEKRPDWLLLSILVVASGVLGIIKDGTPVLFPFIQSEFGLTRAEIGLYQTILLLSFTLTAVFTGRIVDLLGSKKGMVFGVSISGLLIAFYAAAYFFSYLLIMAFFLGIVISMIVPATSKGVIECFSPQKRATSMGFVQSGIGIGSFFAALILPFLAQVFNWRISFLFTGLFSMLLGLFIYQQYSSPQANRETKEKGSASFLAIVLTLLRNRYFFVLCVLGFIFGFCFSATNTHYTLFLHQDYLLPISIASTCFGILHVGGIIGRLGWGYLSDKVFHGDRKKGFLANCIALIIMIFVFYLFNMAKLPLFIFFMISFLMGFSALGYFGLYATSVSESTNQDDIGTAFGISLIFIRLGGMLSPPVFGYIADLKGDYSYSWLFIGIFLMIGTVVFYTTSS